MSRFNSVSEALESFLSETRVEGQEKTLSEAMQRISFLSGMIAAIGLENEGMEGVAEQAMLLLAMMPFTIILGGEDV